MTAVAEAASGNAIAVLLRTLFIDILGLGPTGLAARSQANQQLADLMLDVVNNRPGERKRTAPLQPMMAMAVVGASTRWCCSPSSRTGPGNCRSW